MKVPYGSLKLKVNKDVETFTFNDSTIEVLQYLPIEAKNDLVLITLQESEEDGIYNPIKLELHFNMNLIYMYSNLSFTEKQKEDEGKLYDTLKSNGFIYQFIACMSEEEYEYLFNIVNEYSENITKYKTTAASVIQSIITDLPKNAEIAANVVNNFDKEKFGEVVKFAEAVNGGNKIE